jgi:hypothetical protein
LADELYKLLKVTYLAKEHVTFSIWFHTSWSFENNSFIFRP